MEGFGLLLGHLVGDYILQWDWLAANKGNPDPGPDPRGTMARILGAEKFRTMMDEMARALMLPNGLPEEVRAAQQVKLDAELAENAAYASAGLAWEEKRATWRRGHLACTLHCALYTLAVWLFSFWWMPWWGLVLCFVAHWPLDRFKLAPLWMKHVSGQAVFADKLGPWSCIIVDNIFHLLVLWAIYWLSVWLA